jgi:UDP-3-O-[3-hydroxymyristoyl] glucosamine N-acyltransferase
MRATITTGGLAELIGARLIGPGDTPLTHLDAIDRAGPGALTFIRTAKYLSQWGQSRATAALVAQQVPLAEHESPAPGRSLLVVPNADVALAKATEFFAPPAATFVRGVHPSAVIDPTATVAPTATIGPLCTVLAGAVIGDGVVMVAQVHVGAHVRIGARTVLQPQVSVMDHCEIGADCNISSGTVIGAEGFGYTPVPDPASVNTGGLGYRLQRLPHIGNVILEDEVEIGANSCVDRAKFGSTVIGRGTKIDNLVQIGHNCRIGRNCIICGEVGISGSVTMGDGCMLGGKAGIADNLTIGAGAKIAAYAAVAGDVPAGAEYLGMPAGPADEMRRAYVAFRRSGRRKK